MFRIRGVAVKVHGSLLLVAGVLLVLALPSANDAAEIGQRLLMPLILLATLVLHELGHALAARRLGIPILDIVLTPLGGMARLKGHIEHGGKEATIAAAGPFTNLLLAAACYMALVVSGDAGSLTLRETFLLEVQGEGLFGYDPIQTFFCFNMLLGTLNLVPAFPMDGGRILRGLLALQIGQLHATRIACRLGFWTSVMLVITPFVADGNQWWVLPFIGVYLILAGLRERLIVEAREGLKGANPMFRMFTNAQGGGPWSGAGGQDSSEGQAETSDDPDVIDVSGQSRVISDGEEH